MIAAELVANAVRHGHVPGRDFHLRLTESAGTLRLEVSDTRTERLPELRVPAGESGRAAAGRGARRQVGRHAVTARQVRLGGGTSEPRHPAVTGLTKAEKISRPPTPTARPTPRPRPASSRPASWPPR
ncbi:ATP-binding protein [Streptomyces puniciscabiei]